MTVAPMRGSAFASLTFPLTVMSWAYSVELYAINIKIARKVCLINCFNSFILSDFDS